MEGENIISTDKSNGVKKTFKSIVAVTISNIFTIVAGIFVGFFVPKILSVSDYGFYKTFTLYVGYVGLASLGIIDGIVLKYGGTNYENIDKVKFRSYFLWYLIINAFFSFLILIIGFFIFQGPYKIVLLFFGIDLIAANFTGYYQYISQICMRFKELTTRNIIKSLLTVSGVLVLYILKLYSVANYWIYILIVVLCNYALTFWYLFTYREISFGRSLGLSKTFKDVLGFIKIGFPLFFSLLCSSLVLTIDRQFVNIFFENDVYALYAFAYNMLSLITVATSAISTVIYPTLKRSNENDLVKNYHLLVALDIIFVSFCLTGYFVLSWFVPWFLPKYVDSLPIFRIILPGLVISSSITVIMHNYYKTFGMSLSYFVISVIVLIISLSANFVSYFVWGTTVSISWASIVTISIWYVCAQCFLSKKKNLPFVKNTLYLIVVATSFYFVSIIGIWYIGLLVYLGLFVLTTCLFYFRELKQVFCLFKRG